jgi:glutaredoxin
MARLTLYTKPDCPLCDYARELIERVRGDLSFEFEEFDITSDPALVRAYGERIPVLLLNGAIEFEYRVDERELRRKIVQAPEPVA